MPASAASPRGWAPLLLALAAARPASLLARADDASQAAAREADDISALQLDLSEGRRVVQAMNNFKDIEYTVNVTFGSQKIRAIVDTGSFEFLVYSDRCTTDECKMNPRRFKTAESETFQDVGWRKIFVFGSGDVIATLATDEIRLGSMRPYRQAFWNVHDTHMPILKDGTFEAIIGVGNPREPVIEVERYLEEDRKQMGNCERWHMCPAKLKRQRKEDLKYKKLLEDHPTILSNLKIDHMSLCLQPENGGPGYLVWNDRKPSDYDSLFKTAKITGTLEWKAELSNVYLRGGSAKLNTPLACQSPARCAVLFDTGTSLLMAPHKMVGGLAQVVQDLHGKCSNVSAMPDLVFTIDGHEMSLPPQAYIGRLKGNMATHVERYFPHMRELLDSMNEGEIHATSEGRCAITMMANDAKSEDGFPLMILGLPFFRYYYTTFSVGSSDNAYSSRTVSVAKTDRFCNHPSEQVYYLRATSGQRGEEDHGADRDEGRPDLQEVDVEALRLPLLGSRLPQRTDLPNVLDEEDHDVDPTRLLQPSVLPNAIEENDHADDRVEDGPELHEVDVDALRVRMVGTRLPQPSVLPDVPEESVTDDEESDSSSQVIARSTEVLDDVVDADYMPAPGHAARIPSFFGWNLTDEW